MEIQNANKSVYTYLPWLNALCLFMQTLDGTILNTALPSIAKSMNQSPLDVQSVIVSYTLTLALFIPLSGWLSDKLGTKKIFVWAVGIFTLGSLLCGLSPNLPLLIMSRIVQAIGGAMMVPVARLAVLYTFPKDKLLKVMNFITIPALIGPVIGPSIGGWIVENASWHWIFFVNIPIGIILMLMAARYMPDYKRPVGSFDKIGLFLFSIALVLITLGFELASGGQTRTWVILSCIAVALIFLFFYIVHARRVKNPLIDLGYFKIRTLKVGILGNLFTRLGIGGVPFLIPLLLQIGFGKSAQIAGFILIPSAVANLVAKPLVVPLVKRLGYKAVLLSNTILLAIIVFMFSFPTTDTPLYYFIPLMFVYGMVNGIQLTAMNTISLADLDNNNASGGNSIIAIMQQLSMSFGVSVAGFLLSKYSSWDEVTGGEITTAFKYSFMTLGVITLLSSAVFFLLKPSDGDNMSGHK